jgi:hypothetical protein
MCRYTFLTKRNIDQPKTTFLTTCAATPTNLMLRVATIGVMCHDLTLMHTIKI